MSQNEIDKHAAKPRTDVRRKDYEITDQEAIKTLLAEAIVRSKPAGHHVLGLAQRVMPEPLAVDRQAMHAAVSEQQAMLAVGRSHDVAGVLMCAL